MRKPVWLSRYSY